MATCIGTKAEMNAQWCCPAPEVRGGAGCSDIKFMYQFRNYQEEGFLCGLTCGRDAAAQAKPLSTPHLPISPWS